ncbi:BMP family ABC transporter substrate-binding protein [Planobispora rosea]|uniref:BMP family ABC transporter substrate-binding protein n=1 Tax=Planobispora rosea TaxID=35762 RepID=A0A8J3S2W5_PLARO|nr:BMP family ABC transporter substrate-binding protein [Planobispora rosea]GGS81978.1 BMP family ABC transporter substrate-binding protein [Planobispora rosea]GIH86078.1 BMP family ABC transporter substrate-binding protein [Planobispora rosea]
MLHNRFGRLAASALAGTMLMGAAACGGSEEPTTTASPGTGATSAAPGGGTTKVGLAYDIGGRGDQSFNDAAAAGLDKAKTELGLAEAKELEAGSGETEAAKEERLRLLAQGGFNPIIAVGFAYSKPLAKVAAEFPDVKFAIVDDAEAKAANITNLLFAEHEGSFLVGAAAALKSEKNHVGFVGGVRVPLIDKFEAGFEAGAKAVKPDIKIESTYLSEPPEFSGFNDPAKGKTAAEGMFDAGADVVYHAAGGSGGGVFEAAKAANGKAIGVDSDQAKTAAEGVRDVIMTSMIKKVDVAVFDFLKSVSDGSVASGPKVYDLKAGGVDYSTTGGQVDDIKTKLDEYKQKIVSGEITVPDKTS